MNMKLPAYLQDEIHREDLPVINLDVSVDFSDYVWMVEEEIEDFDRQVEEEFWEEAFLEACFEEMLDEEDAQWQYFSSPTLKSPEHKGLHTSKLNPNAPEFVPMNSRKSKA